MKISRIQELLEAKLYCCRDNLEKDVQSVFGCDLMSDALAYVNDQAVLLTGLVNPQVIRTAVMMDMRCIVFVRGKRPPEDVISLADDAGLVVLATEERMYTACGKLYAQGLTGGEVAHG